jgi:ABC-type multidrug transport system ATPase subunit
VFGFLGPNGAGKTMTHAAGWSKRIKRRQAKD